MFDHRVGKRTRPCSSIGSNCVRETIAVASSSWQGEKNGSWEDSRACSASSTLWPKASSAASKKDGADIDAVGVLRREDMAIGRGNADPPFAIERTHHRRNERLDGHGLRLTPSRPKGLWGGTTTPARTTWFKPLGRYGIAWEITTGQPKSIGN